MKKIYVLILLFTGVFLFAQQKTKQNNQPVYTSAQLVGFDKAAAWQKAMQKSQKPFEQTEYYNSLERMYVQSKMKVNTQILHSNVSYSATTNANKTIINLGTYSSYCPNADFSNANFSNWTGGTYNNSAGTNWNTFTPAWTTGIVTNGNNNPTQPFSGFSTTAIPRHTILTVPPTVNNPPANCIGWDSITIGYPNHVSDIPFVPPTGGGVTCRLGNANPNYETEELSYVLNVSAANAQFTFAYAVVLYDGGHLSGEQPFFKVTMTDQNGNPIPGCGQYQVDATLVSTDPTFHKAAYYNGTSWVDGSDPLWFSDIYYKNWTTVGVDLTPYIGTNVTITFQTADCIFGGHWGYAYIDASCSPATAVVNMCQGLNTQQVIGPSGYVSYQWYGPNGNTTPIAAPQGTSDTLVVQNGSLGDTYTVTAVSANGCTTSMQAVLQYSQINVLYTNSTPSCPGGNSGTASIVGTGSPTGLYTYNWLNSLGQSVGSTQQVNGLASGTYSVHIASSTASCGSHDTTVTVGIAPPVISTQTKNFCGSAAYLLAPVGSSNIQWYAPGGVLIPGTQGTNDTLLAVGASNGQVYAVTYNSSGCRDSLLITLTQVSGGTLSHSVTQNVCSNNTYGQYNQPSTGQATINLSTTALPPYNYSIVGPAFNNSYPNSSATSFTFSALAYGSYTVAAFDGTCFYNDIFRIDTIPVPVNISVAPTTLCNGQSALLTFTFNSAPPTQCQTSNLPCTNPSLLTCGPSNTVTPSSFTYPTPFGNYYTKMRAQYIYTATELIAAGINAGNLSSIAFNITNMNTSITSYPNFNISVGCSGQSTFTSLSDVTSLITGLTNVYSSASANIAAGVNTYPFAQPYSWDGSSNLIVDVCFEVPGTFSYTTNAQVSCSNTTNYSSLSIYSDTDPTCNPSTTAFYQSFPAQMRPVATFGWCNAVANASMYNYSLNTNAGVVGGLNAAGTTTIQPTTTTHYILNTTTNYGGLSCFKTDSFTLHVIQPFNITSNRDSLYCTSTNSVPVKANFTDVVTHQPVTEAATWSIINNLPGLTGNDGFGTANFSPHNAGVGTYTLVVSAGGQCLVTDTVVFKVDTFNTANFFVPKSIFCLTDGNIQLRPTTLGGIWSGAGISNNGIFSPYNSGGTTNPSTSIIKYVVNGGTPCADTATATMTIYKNPTVTFITDTIEGCAPNTNIWFSSAVTPSVTTGSYQWYFSDGKKDTTRNTSHIYTIAGLYSPKVVYTDVNGCKDSSTHVNSITVHAPPTAGFYANPATTDILAPHVDFTNTTVPTNCTWAWDIAGLDTSSIKNTSHNFDDPGHFIIQLTATSIYHCKDVYTLDLNITGAYALYVPSGFTPNGDGKNELFKADGFGLADNNIGYKMEVYDRWGQRLFETTDLNTGWDGSKNGVALGQDIYVYSITFKDYEGRSHNQKGQVLLIR